MSTQHTPGPWLFIGTFIGTDEEDPQTIAYVDQHRNRRMRVEGEQEANARLIAAAPELLEALQLAFRHLNGGSDSLTPIEHDKAFKLARAAIAKATAKATTP